MDKAAIQIQSAWRGFQVRKNACVLKDCMTKDLLETIIDKYIDYYKFIDSVNQQLNKKKCRHENLPSHISENICKFAIAKKYKMMPCWDTLKGDLQLYTKQLEVKGFISDGPSSFGPNESWERIYFVDAKDILQLKFKVYEMQLANNSEIWRSVQMSSKNTYGTIADANKRGLLRASFYKVFYPQLKTHCKLIFDGHFSELF